MTKKIEWIKHGMTANNGLHMQEVCDQIAHATTEINNRLQKPTTAPSATQLVAVDNTNTQTMLNIGDGLSVENGALKSNGKQLFEHIITIEPSGRTGYRLYFNIITDNSTSFTLTTLAQYLYNKNITTKDNSYPVSLYIEHIYDYSLPNISGIYSTSGKALNASYSGIRVQVVEGQTYCSLVIVNLSDFSFSSSAVFSDTVIEL